MPWIFKRRKKEEKPEATCSCSLCTLLNSMEPELKDKPYGASLRKFVVSPTGAIEKPIEKLEEEARGLQREKKLRRAALLYQILTSRALIDNQVPLKKVKGYLRRYASLIGRTKLASAYLPGKRDCTLLMNHLDEVAELMRKAYRGRGQAS